MGRRPRSHDPVKSPKHYTSHASGIECIQINEHMGFCLGNVIKYVWRADLKGSDLEDLRKARYYLDREISRRLNLSKRENSHHLPDSLTLSVRPNSRPLPPDPE